MELEPVLAMVWTGCVGRSVVATDEDTLSHLKLLVLSLCTSLHKSVPEKIIHFEVRKKSWNKYGHFYSWACPE